MDRYLLNKFSNTCIARMFFSFVYTHSFVRLESNFFKLDKKGLRPIALTHGWRELHERIFLSRAMSVENLCFKRLQGCKVI